MKPERWQQIDKLLEAVLEQEESQRTAFLDRACAGDEALRKEVETLLVAYQQAGSLIESPALEIAAKELAQDQAQSAQEEDREDAFTLAAGTQLGRYQLEEKVGAGGFGEVFRASDPLLKRTVAIKVMRMDTSEKSADRVKKSLREARSASALNHPSIVTIHDVGQQQGLAYIVMEWIEGQTLREKIASTRISSPQFVNFSRQIASALGRAHTAGIVHRDLKPENIMVRPDNVVKILDFGLASQRPSATISQTETATGKMMGTMSYMAPEQLNGEPADAASDLFSLGIVLYEMATGMHPFAAATPFATMQRVLHTDPAPPDATAQLPAGWNEMILQLLTKDRAARAAYAPNVLKILEPGELSAETTLLVKAQQAQRVTHMVGRSAELAAIEQHWEKAISGNGAFVMVTGEPGLGKTTLVQNFLQSLEEDSQTMVATGRCSERLGSGEPYLPFLEALTEMAGSRHGALLRAILKSKAPTWFMQLFPTSSSDSSFEQISRELVGGSQERMRRELVEAMEEIGKSYAVCILLEDIHWSDLATTELIAYLGKRIATLPLLVMGTYRPSELLRENHPLRSILLEIQGHGISAELALGFLSKEDVDTYLALEYEEHRFPPQFAAWIHQKTEGNPLFLVDLLHYLVKRQAIVRAENWQLVKPIENLEGNVPASVRSMIERKMETLSEDQRKLLSVASVQGETFDTLIVAQVAKIDELRLEEELETLNRMHGLVKPVQEVELEDGALTVRYKFVHVLYQNTLYLALTAKRRILLHAQVGETLEQHVTSRTGSITAELAQHFDRARQPGRALPYYLKAAENAVSKFANVQAETYCSRALELADKLPQEDKDRQRLSILLMRGQTRFDMSQFDNAVADFQEMLASAERLDDVTAQANGRYQLGLSLFFSKRNDELEEQTERLFVLAREHQLGLASAQGHHLLGAQRSCYGHLDEASQHLHQAEQEARQIDDRAILASALTWQGEVFFLQSHYEQALPILNQAGAVAMETHDSFSLLMGDFFRGLTYANSARLAEGIHQLEDGRERAEKNYDLFWLGRFPNCIAWVHHEVFDFERSLELNREAVEIARQTGFLEPEANAKINIGIEAIELGEYDLARKEFLEVEDIFARDEWFKWRYRLRLEIGWSELLMCLGNPAQACTHAEECRKQAEKAGVRKYLALAHRQLGRIALMEDRIPEAERHLNTATEQTKDLQIPLAAWKVNVSLGELYRATHRQDEAATCFGAAAQLLRHIAEQSPEPMQHSILTSEQFRALEK